MKKAAQSNLSFAYQRRELRRTLHVIGHKSRRSCLSRRRPDGEYQAHELIRYQIRTESEVIWGDRKIKGLVRPVSLQAALHDIVPKVLSHGVTRIRVEFPQAEDELAFIAENRNTFFIIARTILALNERNLGTKEEAIPYVTGRYPFSKRLGELLLRLHRNERALPSDLPSSAEVETFLFLAETSIRSFAMVDCSGRWNDGAL